MRKYVMSLALLVLFGACDSGQETSETGTPASPVTETSFDPSKWREKDGEDYPYREDMLEEVVYNDTIRSLNEDQLIGLLGEPDRKNEEYLYYRISQTKLFAWALKTKTMVIKLSDRDTVEWIKIHG